MDGHRNLPDDAEARSFAAEAGFSNPDWEWRPAAEGHLASPEQRFPDEPSLDGLFGDANRYRVPEPRVAGLSMDGDLDLERLRDQGLGRHSDPMIHPSGSGRWPNIAPRGSETITTGGAAERRGTESIRSVSSRRPEASTSGDGVYRRRRPGLVALLAVLTALAEVGPLRLLLAGFSAADVPATIVGTFLSVGLPMFAIGLYALLTGAAVSPARPPLRPWLRAPLVCLPVALVLFLAAALAV